MAGDWFFTVITTAILALMIWLAWEVWQAQREMHAVAALQRSGVSLFLTSQEETGVRMDGPILPDVIESLVQIGDVRSLSLTGSEATDADAAALPMLSGLRAVDLRDSAITDAGLRHLARMPELLSLDLRGTRVGDDGLRWLTGLKKLTELDLRHTRVTARGVDELRRYVPELIIRW